MAALRRDCRHGARVFLADDEGAGAVEFALVSVPFIFLLGAIVQMGLVFWATQSLDNNLQKAVRSVYVGSFQSANQSGDNGAKLASLKAKICAPPGTVSVFPCSGLRLDVSVAASFSAGTAPSPLDTETNDWSKDFGSNYACAKPGDVVVVTAAVKYPLFFGFLKIASGSFSDGSRLLQSSAVFRTEPGTSSC